MNNGKEKPKEERHFMKQKIMRGLFGEYKREMWIVRNIW